MKRLVVSLCVSSHSNRGTLGYKAEGCASLLPRPADFQRASPACPPPLLSCPVPRLRAQPPRSPHPSFSRSPPLPVLWLCAQIATSGFLPSTSFVTSFADAASCAPFLGLGRRYHELGGGGLSDSQMCGRNLCHSQRLFRLSSSLVCARLRV